MAISPACGEDEACLSVCDGADNTLPELLFRVFDVFIQGSRSLDRTHGGLGNGLSLANRLIELHGDTVQANNAGIRTGSTRVIPASTLLMASGVEVSQQHFCVSQSWAANNSRALPATAQEWTTSFRNDDSAALADAPD